MRRGVFLLLQAKRSTTQTLSGNLPAVELPPSSSPGSAQPSPAASAAAVSRRATVLIPTFNRPDDIARLARFCASELRFPDVDFILLDGSVDQAVRDRNQASCSLVGWTYRACPPQVSLLERILSALEVIKTPFVTILGDDDILVGSGFVQCLDFLAAHPEYAVAHGQYIGFTYEQSSITIDHVYPSPSFEHESPLDRIFLFVAQYSAPLFYAVHRTPLLRTAFREIVSLAPAISDSVTIEIGSGIIPLFSGKAKRLNAFYCARRRIPSNTADGYSRYLMDPQFSHRHARLKAALLRHAPANTPHASEALDYAFGAFFAGCSGYESQHLRKTLHGPNSPLGDAAKHG